MGVSIRVSDYDLTKGVPEYNLSTSPNPSTIGGSPDWRMLLNNTAATATQEVIESDDLLAETGIAPRREDNRYAVTTITSASADDGSVIQDPNDYVRAVPNSTLTISQFFYVKSSATTIPFGFGVGRYDQNYGMVGSAGDGYEGVIPTNEWVRVSFSESIGGSPSFTFLSLLLTLRSNVLSVGDVVASTDVMQSYNAGAEYFDGDYADSENTEYSWTDNPWRSTSYRVTRIPSSVTVFPPDNIIDYRVSEESMSMNPADFSGGYGQITFDIDRSPDAKLLRGKTFELEDNIKGKTTGVVTGMNAADYVSVTTDSMLGVLNSWHKLEPYSGTFATLIDYVFGVVELTLPVRFEDDIDQREVVSRGYVGNLWDWMKNLLSAQQIEIALVYNTVVFRPYRTYEAYTARATEDNWNISQGETAKSVEVTYYNNEYRSGEFYPISYDDVDNSPVIMQVDAGETVEYVLQLSSTPVAIDEPFVQYTVTDGPQSVSVYAVAGNDDLPIQPAQWNKNGGNLQVALSENDPTQAVVTVTGASITSLAPFRIAMSSGAGNYYNSLHLTGQHVAYTPRKVLIHTGASVDITGTEVGVVVENHFIQTKAQAFDLGMKVAAGFSGGNLSISGSAWNINRRGYTGGIYAQISNFNAGWELGSDIGNFNEQYQGMDIAQFNAMWDQTVLDEFPVQAFGNAAGARVREADAYYRIRAAEFGPGEMSYTAEMDTTIGDFNEIWTGYTVGDFNEEFFNKLIRDYSAIPLRRDDL